MSDFDGLNWKYHSDINAEIEGISEVLCKGNINSLEEYKRLVGRRQGLVYSLERHKELLTLLEQAKNER